MPKEGVIVLKIDNDGNVCTTARNDYKKYNAIEVPSHGRLGDLDALLSTVRRIYRSDGTFVGEFPFVTPYEIAEADTIISEDLDEGVEVD